MTPGCWRLWVVNLEPWVGSKPGKQRPCLTVQPSAFGEAGLSSTVILPLTTKVVGGDAFPLRVHVPAGVCGLEKASDVMVDQILAWDNTLFVRDMGPFPVALLDRIKDALRTFLDLR
jgi:mRNA interferase MazF